MRGTGVRELGSHLHRWSREHWEYLLVASITLVAALLRLLFLAQFPLGLQGDEAWMGLESQRIVREGWIGIWTPVGWGQPTGVFYWTAFLFRFLPDTVGVLRAAIALLSVATIPVSYLFVRSLFGRRAALIGTALLAFSYWDIHYSRTAFSLIAAPLVECGTLLFLAKGIEKRRTWPFLVAGLLAGLGVYTYRGYLFFALLLMASWGTILLTRPYDLKRLTRHTLAFALPAVLVALPMLLFILNNYGDYSGYGRVVSIFANGDLQAATQKGEALSFLMGKAERAIAIYYYGGSADFTDGLGSSPLLDPVALALFSIGLVICLWRWRCWQSWLLLGGVAMGLATVAATVSWGENRRGILALPLVFAAAGVGGDALIAFLQRLSQRFRTLGHLLRPAVAYPCLVGLLLFLAGWNSYLYFGNIARSETMRFAYAYELSRASSYLDSLEGEKPYVYFYSDRWSWSYEARRFQAPGLEGEDRSQVFGRFSLERGPHYQRVLYLLMPPYDRYQEEIEELYPSAECTTTTEGGRLLFVACLLD
ncbi:MAG: glycosyltransferase family 39 protein [Chloroflexi bacterium]|nr:glycosyltransferase family 39 protein [Chloroflexota bacterium]